MENNILPLVLLLAFSISGCGYRNKPNKKTVERPIIYDAWDARYSYEMESRRLVPMHHGRQVGRTWGRDEKGKIHHATYLSSNQKNEEDLFVLHSQQLDRKRDKKWENSKEQRIDFIKNQMEILEEEENAPFVEVLIEEEEDEFVPPAFIPQGIDLDPVENPADTENVGDLPPAFPFAPLP